MRIFIFHHIFSLLQNQNMKKGATLK